MMQRWSTHLAVPLRTLMRRGVLFLMGGLIAVLATLSPLAAKDASAVSLLDIGTGGNSCSIETVGWVICPTMRSIARLADKGFAYVNQDSLGIDYELFNNNGRTFNAWEIMRNIANGLFVIVFLFIIYGYLVGRVSGTYNIKRLLPRMLIAVILVNVSYFLAVIFVDVSNIVGDAVWNFMKQVYGSGSPVLPLGVVTDPSSNGNLTKMTGAAMGDPSMVWALMPLIGAVTITVAVVSAITVILIIMREALVTALILAAPVLIVLYLLPNTERFSSQAMRMFVQLLILYPIIALLLGVGQIVSMAASSRDPSAFYGGGTTSIVPDLIAAAAAVVPLLAVWFIFKNMSALMSTAGSRLSASLAGRRGEKDSDKNARIAGKAQAGLAGLKKAAGLGDQPGRRQAFNRNRRRRSLSGSSLTGGEGENQLNGTLPDGAARRPAANADALEAALQASDAANSEKRAEELQNANLNGDADNLNLENAAAAALESSDQNDGKKEQDKPKTAKDIFNNMSHAHESKDKDRKLSGAQAPAGSDSGAAAGTAAAPTAPSTSYRAPSIAQGGNIVTGGGAQQPAKIIAIPVQVDASALLGQNNAGRPPENMAQPPISGTEEKAKARAQKYLFDSGQGTDDEAEDILGKSDGPSEQPHVPKDKDDKERSD